MDAVTSIEKSSEVRNKEVVQARWIRLTDISKPWFDNVLQSQGRARIEFDDQQGKGRLQEFEEKYIADCVTTVLDIALHNPSVVEAQSKGVKSEAPARTEIHHDPLYATLELRKEPGSESIRLLELLPGSSSDVHANMFCVPKLGDCSYQALSYTWGQETVTNKITVNGREVLINRNLHDALSSFRLADRSRTIWVDAICINQKDDDEKASQIAMMGAIYRQAETVLIFLGMPSAQSYLFFDFLDRDTDGDDITEENVGNIIDACKMDKVALLSSFVEFCQREWWTRVWVMQEYFMSRGEPRWYIGSRYVYGSRLCRDLLPMGVKAVHVFSPLGQAEDVSLGVDKLTMGSFATILKRLSGTVYSRLQPDFYISPRRLFTKLDRQAANPRDYVYGQLELLEVNFRQVFPPDYSRNPYSLFEKLGAWLLIMDGWGDMLWWYPKRLSSRPTSVSWAPDFTRRVEPESRELVPPSLSSLAKDHPKTVQCAIVNRVLHLEGYLFDSVQEVFKIPEDDSFKILQSVWQLDRVYCSNQRASCFPPQDSSRNSILNWATSIRPTKIPLAPRWMGLSQVIGLEFSHYMEELSTELARLPSHTVSIDGPAILREMGHVHRLSSFLTDGMEGDFVSACVFDFDNLISQLQGVEAAIPDGRRETQSQKLNYLRTSYSSIYYQDLIQFVQTYSEGERDFRALLWLVIKTAKKIYQSRNDPVSKFSLESVIERTINMHKQGIEQRKNLMVELELDLERYYMDESAAVQMTDRQLRISRLRSEIGTLESTQNNLIKRSNSDGVQRVLHNDDKSWDRISNDMAALFRGREFFLTTSGHLGLGSPGVHGIEAGDGVLLLDGLTFPLLARRSGRSQYAVVGCANVRGVELRDRHEEAVLPDGYAV